MTINEIHSWFNIVLDQYNEPYFIDSEIDEFVNNGATEFVNDIIFKEYFPSMGENEKGIQALNSMESVIQGSEILQPLIIPSLTVASTAGVVSNPAIEAQLAISTGDANDKLMHVIAVTTPLLGEDRLVRYVRHSDRARFNQNEFKKATARNPIFTVVRGGLLIDPVSVTSVNVSILKTPRKVSKQNQIGLDLPSFTHQKIIAYAISMSGVASRDDVLLQLQQLSGNGTNRNK